MRFSKIFKLLATSLIVLSMVSFSPITTQAEQLPVMPFVPLLTYMTRVPDTIIAGEYSNLSFKLYDQANNPYSGAMSAYFISPEGDIKTFPLSGAYGIYGVSGLHPLKAGNYTLKIVSGSTNKLGKSYSAQDTIIVLDSKAIIEGDLTLNSWSHLKVQLVDSKGKALDCRDLTVDASEVGVLDNNTNQESSGLEAGIHTFKTLNDGTIRFSITPTRMGTIYFENGGIIVGSLSVKK